MSNEINKSISTFVESQFPSHYREEGDLLVAFVKAYYEYLEESGHTINRDMFEIKDIDTTYDLFVSEFRKKYLDSIFGAAETIDITNELINFAKKVFGKKCYRASSLFYDWAFKKNYIKMYTTEIKSGEVTSMIQTISTTIK